MQAAQNVKFPVCSVDLSQITSEDVLCYCPRLLRKPAPWAVLWQAAPGATAAQLPGTGPAHLTQGLALPSFIRAVDKEQKHLCGMLGG